MLLGQRRRRVTQPAPRCRMVRTQGTVSPRPPDVREAHAGALPNHPDRGHRRGGPVRYTKSFKICSGVGSGTTKIALYPASSGRRARIFLSYARAITTNSISSAAPSTRLSWYYTTCATPRCPRMCTSATNAIRKSSRGTGGFVIRARSTTCVMIALSRRSTVR